MAAIFPFNEIEFFASPSCDASGSGEGKTYLGKLTGPANNFTFNAAVSVPAGSVATATYVFGNLTPLVTSKFSNCVPIATCAANVTGQVAITRGGLRLNRATGRYAQIVRVTNNGEALTSPLSLTFDSLAAGVTLYQPGGTTSCSAPFSPYLSLPAGLAQGAFVDLTVEFTNPSNGGIQYGNRLLSGTNR